MSNYSKKMKDKLKSLLYAGFFTVKQAKDKKMRFVCGKAILLEQKIHLYWLVDETDGVIADVCYQVIGEPSLIAFAEILAEKLMRKNYDQASRISASFLEKEAGLKENHPFSSSLNVVVDAIDDAVHQCLDIPFKETYEDTPLDWEERAATPMEDWPSFSKEKKLSYIHALIEKQIRPYIELDAGGIEVVDLNEKEQLFIRYSGSCTSCYAATGSTLSAIQNIVHSHLHPTIEVVPEL